jgi:hypothetical protein
MRRSRLGEDDYFPWETEQKSPQAQAGGLEELASYRVLKL